MENSSNSFRYFVELLKKGISPDINSTERNLKLLKERNFKKGNLVILQEQKVPRSHWSFGRVTKMYPDPGGVIGVIRIVKLRTS